jgi:hypothetical protein
LCEQANNEQDPKKLVQLIDEINRLLEEKQKRLEQLRFSQQKPRLSANWERGQNPSQPKLR